MNTRATQHHLKNLKRTRLSAVLALGLLLSALVWGLERGTAAPFMATIIVESTADGPANAANCPGPNCRLRDAIAAAAAGDTITFSALFDTAQTITLSAGELTISQNLTINGPGANKLTISGNQQSRVFNISGGAAVTVALHHLTIANGLISTSGAGLFNNSQLTLTGCVISGNSASGSYSYGGGIDNAGTLTLLNCTLVGNSNNGSAGGGIFNDGTLTLTNCTLSGNFVNGSGLGNGGGGIYNQSGTLTLTNCTLSGNAAGNADGAALSNYGGGIFNFLGVVKLRNTLIAGNTVRRIPPLSPEVGGDFTSLGHNLIGNNVGSNGFTHGNNGDLVGTSAAPLDPQLAPLADNGGPTPTHALLANSPALEAGDNCVLTNVCTSDNLGFNLTTDQRGAGFARLVGNRVDIGAFELGLPNTAPMITALDFALTAGSPAVNQAIATVSDTEDDENTLSVIATRVSGSGVTLHTIAVSPSGNVTATVQAGCSATTSTFTLRVTDSGTLAAEATLTVTVTPETTPPDTSITNGPAAISPATVSFNFSGTDNCTVSGFECKLDGGGWTACASGQSYSGLSNSAHTFQVRAKDAAGNVDATPAVYNWHVFVASCGTVVNPATLIQASIGQAFAQVLSATPSGTYNFSLFAGTLPPGLQIVNTAGVFTLQGTPTTPGTYTFTIRGQRVSTTCEGIRTYTLTVAPTVVPKVTCKTLNSNGSYTVRFGYENTTGAAVTIPVGANNMFTSGAANRGQTTVFQPGVVTNAFSVTFANAGAFAGWYVKGPDGVLRGVVPSVLTPNCP